MRLLRLVLLVLAALVPLAQLQQAAQACSRVMWKTDRQGVFAGRSMDWDQIIDPRLVVYPRGLAVQGGVDNAATWTSRFGSVVVLGANYDDAAVDGMNEQGLTVHLLYLGATQYEQRDARPGVSGRVMLRFLLDTSATVVEALQRFAVIQVVPIPTGGQIIGAHLALEDASGDSAIIEFVDGKMVVHHGPQYTVMTNDPPYDVAIKELAQYHGFGGKKPIPGNIESIERFVRAAYFLKYLPQPRDPEQGVAFMFQVIHTVAVPFGAPYSGGRGETYPTWWITGADLTNRIYYFAMAQNPNVIWVKLDNLDFSPSQPELMLDPTNPSLTGDVGLGFRPRPGKGR